MILVRFMSERLLSVSGQMLQRAVGPRDPCVHRSTLARPRMRRCASLTSPEGAERKSLHIQLPLTDLN